MQDNPKRDHNKDSAPRLRDVIASTFAAAIGIQSSKNRERDFKHGNFKIYVIAGLIFTIVFVTSVFLMVKLVLTLSGAS